ncbi:TPA: hypothetical protein JA361_14970 [Legionella pneumophila]|nr:hypothetical protein [Legionella pneumophila]HAT8181146.1 hypothetical protein [Legionella pneumophila]
MKGETRVIKEASRRKRSKLETPYDSGDCGYYAICVGLLHLGIQARKNKALVETINKSEVLSTIFSQMQQIKKLIGPDNMRTLENILIEFNDSGWDTLSFKEVLTDFSNGIRSSLMTSDWGLNYFKTMIRVGSWVLDHQKWMDLAPFKCVNDKILDKMIEFADGNNVSIEQAGELRFQATLEIFKELDESTIEGMAIAVIKKYYGTGSEKAWLDDEFLKYFSQQLFPDAENLLFDPTGIEITSNGPSQIHWYVDVPKDDITDSLLRIVNSGSSKDLKEIDVYRVQNTNVDDISSLNKEHKDLLKAQKKLIAKFKAKAFDIYTKYIESLSEDLLVGLFDLACFDKKPPTQVVLDEVLIPIIDADETSLADYTELTMILKMIENMSEKIKKVEKELESKKDQTSVTSLISSGLSFDVSKDKSIICAEQTQAGLDEHQIKR